MVFGNMGDDSGTGVAFTRDPNTGEKVLFGEYLTNAQGEDVVAGIRTPLPISQMRDEMPEIYAQFEEIAERLERHYRDVQDLEFTIERGRLFMLQTRSRPSGRRRRPCRSRPTWSTRASSPSARRSRASSRRTSTSCCATSSTRRPRRRAKSITAGLNASPGAAVGKAVFDADRAAEMAQQGEKVILVRIETSPDDFHGMAAAQGVLTARGGATSHAAVVARQIGKPCVAGCAALIIDYATQERPGQRPGLLRRGVDLTRRHDRRGLRRRAAHDRGALRGPGRAAAGADWADKVRRLQVWTNADKPEEAAQARRYGAQGIGLCRTEHMFREGERLDIVRDAILVAFQATRAKEKPAAGGTLRPTTPPRSPSSTRRWPSSRSSRRATSTASSRPWTACRSSSA